MTKFTHICSVMLLSSASLLAQPKKAAVKPASALDKKVDAMIAGMTLQEKVGQMTEVTLDVVSKTGASSPQIDPEKLKEAIMKYHVGSILNVSGTAYSREHWHDVISSIQDAAAKDRLKIPVIYGIDAIHGVTYTVGFF